MSIYGSQCYRSGGASAAANANVLIGRWGQYAGSVSRSSQLNYLQLYSPNLLSISLAIMRYHDSFPDERIPNSSPTLDGAIDASNTSNKKHVSVKTTIVPVVEGVHDALFRWNNSES
jgi:hypothetical protein